MNKEKLKELIYIRREINILRSDIKELRCTLKGVGTGTGAQKSDVTDTVARAVVLIDEKERLLNEALLRCMEKENEILAEIGKVEDSRIRQVLRCRYVNGYSWLKTANIMGVSAESLKMAYKRWDGKG